MHYVSFENLRVVDNFYQTSLFFPMPTVVISTLCEDGATTRQLYLPAGTAWIDAVSRQRYEGGQYVTVPAPVDVIPVFAREGASVLELLK